MPSATSSRRDGLISSGSSATPCSARWGPQLIDVVERLTHRTVRVFLSGTDESGAAAVELFLLEVDS